MLVYFNKKESLLIWENIINQQIKNEDYYMNTEFEENEFESFIYTLENRSIKDFDIQVSAEDNILTLSTCADNNKYRIVLHAKKISEQTIK